MRFGTGIFTVLLFSSAAFAHAPQDGDVYLTALVPSITIPRPGHYEGLNYPISGDIGLLGEADLDKNGGVEVGIILMHYFSSVHQNGQTITQKVRRVHISTGYRYWFNPHYSVQLGLFSAYSMGEPVTIQNDFAPSKPDTSAIDSTEYGFDASFLVEPLHLWNRFSLIFEARYGHSVTPKAHEDEDFMTVSAGLQFFMQSREDELKK